MKKLALSFALTCLMYGFAVAQTPPVAPAATPNGQDEIVQLNTEVAKLYSVSRFSEALPLAEKAVERGTSVWGADSQKLITPLKNLAEVQASLKKYNEAVSSFQRVIKLQEADPNASKLLLATTLMRAGIVSFEAGRSDTAEDALARALAIRENNLPKTHLQIAEAAEVLAHVSGFKGDWNRAAMLYLKALRIREMQQKGVGETALTNARYGCALFKAGRKDEYDDWKEQQTGDVTTDDRVVMGKAIELVEPAYPEEARLRRITGKVSVQVVLNEQGRPIHACAVTGSPFLHAAAEVAAYQSKFSPTLFEGKPIKVLGIINYNFVEGKRPSKPK